MKPSEHKTVQARILAYAQEAGWSLVSRKEAGQRRGFEPQMAQMGADAEPQKENPRQSAKSAVRNSSDYGVAPLGYYNL